MIVISKEFVTQSCKLSSASEFNPFCSHKSVVFQPFFYYKRSFKIHTSLTLLKLLPARGLGGGQVGKADLEVPPPISRGLPEPP